MSKMETIIIIFFQKNLEWMDAMDTWTWWLWSGSLKIMIRGVVMWWFLPQVFALLPLEKHNVERWGELVVSQNLPLLINITIIILFLALSSSLSTPGRTQWLTWMVQDRFLRSQWPVTRVALASLQQSGRNELISSQYDSGDERDDVGGDNYCY